MKNSKNLLLSLMVLLLAVSMVLVSCDSDSSSSPRKTNSEDEALVTDVVQDVVDPQNEGEEIDYSKALDPYVNDFINELFSGEGTKIVLDNNDEHYVVFKFTQSESSEESEPYVYEGGIDGIVNMPITFELKNVTIESGDLKDKDVSGTIYYTGDPDTITGSVTCGDITYTNEEGSENSLTDFFNDYFGEEILPSCLKEFFANGITIDDDKLTLKAKGSVTYKKTEETLKDDEEKEYTNEYNTIESISLTEFYLKTKEDVQIQKNKYSLEVTGSAELGFTQDDEDKDEVHLTKVEISSATMKLGITNDSGNHTIEITTSFNYPGTIAGVKIPFTFNLSDVKIDGQQIDNLSMNSLLIKSLASLF